MGKVSTDGSQPGHQGLGRRFAPTIVAILVLLVVSAGGFASWTLLNLARAHNHAADTADDLTIDLGQSYDLSQSLDLGAVLTPSLLATSHQHQADVRAALQSIQATGFEPADTRILTSSVDRYLTILNHQLTAALLGQSAEVRAAWHHRQPRPTNRSLRPLRTQSLTVDGLQTRPAPALNGESESWALSSWVQWGGPCGGMVVAAVRLPRARRNGEAEHDSRPWSRMDRI